MILIIKKFKKNLKKIILLAIGCIGYIYIIVFTKPGVLEIIALLLFVTLVRLSTNSFKNSYHKNILIRIFYHVFPYAIALLTFFGLHRWSFLYTKKQDPPNTSVCGSLWFDWLSLWELWRFSCFFKTIFLSFFHSWVSC